MRTVREYEAYEDYVSHQKEKTNDPIRRKKWLGEEWNVKLEGFTGIFSSFPQIYSSGKVCLCLGARTGQEVVALNGLGVNATGIDLVEHKPHVIEGDIHDLEFQDCSFDIVFSNILDHSLDLEKMMKETFRVLKPGGIAHFQAQVFVHQDEYTETYFDDPVQDLSSILPKHTFFLLARSIPQNFAAMNYEMIIQKVS